jgi:hypothetical protein
MPAAIRNEASYQVARGKLQSWPWPAARVLGALALLATGAVHLQQYTRFYSEVPTIGTLFLLNFAGAAVVGLALLTPLERLSGTHGATVVALLAAVGIAIAATAFVLLLISEQTPVFGFQEPGYDPPAMAAARAAEVVTVLSLGAFVVGRVWFRAPASRS